MGSLLGLHHASASAQYGSTCYCTSQRHWLKQNSFSKVHHHSFSYALDREEVNLILNAHTFQALNSFHPAVRIHTLEVLPSSHQGQVTLWRREPTQLTPLAPRLWGQGLYFSGTSMCSEDSSVALLGLGQSGPPSPCDTSQLRVLDK